MRGNLLLNFVKESNDRAVYCLLFPYLTATNL